jgi:hypothetical protein
MAINPFQQPINYTAQMVDLNPAFQGLGQAFRGLGESRQQQERLAQAQAAKQQFELDLQKAQTDGTQAAWTGMIARYPQFREAFGDVRKNIGEERVKGEFTQGFNWSIALENNRPDIVIQGLATTIQAKKNSGEPADTHEQALELLESGEPVKIKQAQSILNGYLATLDPDRFEKSVKARQSLPLGEASLRKNIADADKAVADAKTALATAANAGDVAKADADLKRAQANKAKIEEQFAGPLAQANLNLNAAQIKNINSEIGNRAAKLNLDRQTMQATVAEKLSSIQKNMTEMPADTRKLVNDSAVAAAASKQSANQYNDLAKRLDAAGGGFGAATSFADYLRKATGAQSPLTELRQEYTRIRNSAAIKSLPPGVATDKDIELALKGIPPENANASTMASFLRGMGKMQDIEASVANAKTDWLANNNGVLTRARNTFQAGDYATKPGESFNDFTQRVVQDVSKRYNPAAQSPLVEQIPTDRTPRPAAATSNIRSQADAILRGGQ